MVGKKYEEEVFALYAIYTPVYLVALAICLLNSYWTLLAILSVIQVVVFALMAYFGDDTIDESYKYTGGSKDCSY